MPCSKDSDNRDMAEMERLYVAAIEMLRERIRELESDHTVWTLRDLLQKANARIEELERDHA